MLTLEQCKALHAGQTLYHAENRNADGTPQRWVVNGNVRTWARDASRIHVPLKHGLYSYDAIDSEADGLWLSLTEAEALKDGAMIRVGGIGFLATAADVRSQIVKGA